MILIFFYITTLFCACCSCKRKSRNDLNPRSIIYVTSTDIVQKRRGIQVVFIFDETAQSVSINENHMVTLHILINIIAAKNARKEIIEAL